MRRHHLILIWLCLIGVALAMSPAGSMPMSAADGGSSPAATQPHSEPHQDAQGPLFAVIETDKGQIRVELHVHETPISVANFCNLARRGFYDNTIWTGKSRVVRVAGSPSGTLFYDPGYSIKRELRPIFKFDGPGRVAMLKEKDTVNSRSHGSQFFITIKEQDRWNLDFAIFGQVVSGQEVVNRLEEGDSLKKVTIDGDPAPLFERYEKQIKEWNAVLEDPHAATEKEESPGSPLLRKSPE